MQSHTEWLEDIETRASEAMDKPRNRTELEITLAANLGVKIDAETVAYFDACIVNAGRKAPVMKTRDAATNAAMDALDSDAARYRRLSDADFARTRSVKPADVTVQLRKDDYNDPEQSLWLFTPNTCLGADALLNGFPGAQGPSIFVVGIEQTNRIIQALRGYGLVVAYRNEEGEQVA